MLVVLVLPACLSVQLDQDSEEGAVLGEEDFTSESPNQEALRRRKLPESATRPPPPLEPPRQKRVSDGHIVYSSATAVDVG